MDKTSDLYEKIRSNEEKQYTESQCARTGVVGANIAYQENAKQDPLRVRLENRRRRLTQDLYKADLLSELIHLLDKYPEIARILQLMESVGRD